MYRKYSADERRKREQALAALQASRPKQFQVLALMARGMTQEAIAAELGISQSSVARRIASAEKSLNALLVRILG